MNKTTLAILVAGAAAMSTAFSQTVTSVAGSSAWGQVYNVTVDGAGNLYVPDYTKHFVYKIDPTGQSTTIAGTGRAGYSGDGAQATAAQLNGPLDVAIGPDGSLYIIDGENDRIRKIAPNGVITTVAGTGVGGFTGDGGPATAARMNRPISIVMDSAGNLIFTDTGNLRIRKITPAGIITTVAGTGRLSLSGDGGLATGSDAFPGWLALGPDGSIYFADDGDGRLNGYARIRKVAPNGVISTVAGSATESFSGDGGPARQATLRSASGVAVDSAGNVFIADGRNARIRKVDPGGTITTYAGTGVAGAGGDGGPALSAQFNLPYGLALDSVGNLYVADLSNQKIRKISPPPVPAIRTANPVLTSFMGNAGFSSNTYVEIYGINFSTQSRLWAGADFNGANAPTSLDGVSVLVNGKPAFVYYISPNQININTPEDTAVGPVAIQVKTPFGDSAPVTVNRTRLSPTLQSVPQFRIGGKQYVVALTPDFNTFIGHPGMISGVAFAPAKPGDSIAIYALGCGSTAPPTFAGVVAAQGSPLSSPFTLRIGGVTAQVTFAGAVSGAIGLYQFNLIVPNVPAGDQPIDLTVDGVANGQNLSIVIGQ